MAADAFPRSVAAIERTGPPASAPLTRPAWRGRRRLPPSDASQFFAEKGSIDGGITASRASSTQSGAYMRGEHKGIRLSRGNGRRNAHARRSVVRVVPPDVAPPGDPDCPCRQAVGQSRRLRVVQTTMSLDATRASSVARLAASTSRSGRARRLTEPAAVAGFAVQHVVQALGDEKNSASPSSTSQRLSICGADAVGEQGLQHLGDPSSVGSGVDVPDDPIAEGRRAGRRRPRASSRSAGSNETSRSKEMGRTTMSCMRPCSRASRHRHREPCPGEPRAGRRPLCP